MPNVTVDILKGNYGEAYVEALLSSECLVRRTSADVGIDLYCETVEEDQPFLHFWCQVKAGEKGKTIKVASDGLTASYPFERHHLEYWERQPVPVYVALVPVEEWPVTRAPDVFIIDITSYRLKNKTDLTLHSEHIWKASDKQSIRHFLKEVVPLTTARLLCREGVVRTIPKLRSSYVQELPTMPVARYKSKIVRQIRDTAAGAVLSLHDQGQLNNQHIAFVNKLAKVLEPFDRHWHCRFALAMTHHLQGDYLNAIKLYEQASNCIKSDSRFRKEYISWQERLNDIAELQEKAIQNQPLVD